MHCAMLFFMVVHYYFWLSPRVYLHCSVFDNYASGHRFKYRFNSDTSSTSIDLLGLLVVSVDLDTKSAGPQNLKG